VTQSLQSARIFVNAENPRDASLPLTSSTFQRGNVVARDNHARDREARKLAQRLLSSR